MVWELNRPSPFSIETVDVQPPGPEEVRVKVREMAALEYDCLIYIAYRTIIVSTPTHTHTLQIQRDHYLTSVM